MALALLNIATPDVAGVPAFRIDTASPPITPTKVPAFEIVAAVEPSYTFEATEVPATVNERGVIAAVMPLG